MKNWDVFSQEKQIMQYTSSEKNKPTCFFLMKDAVGEIFSGIHSHELYEMMYVTEGALVYTVKDKVYHLHKGDLVLIPPHTPHRAKDMPYEHSKRIIINFNRAFAANNIQTHCNLLWAYENVENNGHIVRMDSISGKILESLLMRMYGSYHSNQYGDDLIFTIAFLQALLVINRKVKGFPAGGTGAIMDESSFSKIINYIDNNFCNSLSVPIVAQAVRLSPSRVSHIFKEETGLTVMQYVLQRRLNYAKDLIHNGESLSRIWMMCGFSDHTSFLRGFKKQFNITPSAYRKSYLSIV